MYAAESERLFYKMLLEIPFKDYIINIKISDEYITNWTVSDYLYNYFGFKIIDTITIISCRQNKSLNILEVDPFILSLDVISLKNEQTFIRYDKFTYLSQNCIVVKNLSHKLL